MNGVSFPHRLKSFGVFTKSVARNDREWSSPTKVRDLKDDVPGDVYELFARALPASHGFVAAALFSLVFGSPSHSELPDAPRSGAADNRALGTPALSLRLLLSQRVSLTLA